jgi:endonuclease-3 related protein
MDRERLSTLYDRLLEAYGPQDWWPADEPWEIIVGAILTQRASWRNAEIAIDALRREGLLSVRGISGAPEARIAELIRPSIFHNAKAAKLKAFVRAVCAESAGDLEAFLAEPGDRLRRRLLEIHGVGPETADAVLLYAVGRPVFIADAYAFRLFERLGWWDGPRRYEELRRNVMSALPSDAAGYGELHALIVRHGKERCRPRPRCAECTLRGACRFAMEERP